MLCGRTICLFFEQIKKFSMSCYRSVEELSKKSREREKNDSSNFIQDFYMMLD